MPSGRCTPSGRTCNIGIYGPCGSDPNYVGHPYNGYQCHCRSGQWSCEVISRGASVCSNRSPRDASPLDATEATADGRGDATSADADNSRDVALVDANGRCWDLGEESCVANRDRCHAIRGQSYASVCAGQPVSEFFGCVNGGPDGGAAVTWGWDPFTGRRARFATTQLPESWERTEP
ncbi:MAG TPA: hypothetical protein VGG33_04780, partial [Polyangia bacterium]